MSSKHFGTGGGRFGSRRALLRGFALLVAALSLASAAKKDLGDEDPYYAPSMLYTSSGNLALNKRSFQSSTEDEQWNSWGAWKATDGGLSYGSCTKTLARTTTWWAVDLGSSASVATVVIYPVDDFSASEYLDNIEIHVGNTEPKGKGTQNAVCARASPEQHNPDRDSLPSVRIFHCDGGALVGRYVTVATTAGSEALQMCEVMVFGPEKEADSIMQPVLLPNGECPAPLAAACQDNKAQGTMSDEQAVIKAFAEGPIECDKGFFCRVTADPAGINGGTTGSYGDRLTDNNNFGYCVDRTSDMVDWYYQPEQNDGHCHGSEFSQVYKDLMDDHYYRPYRGTITCCCSTEGRVYENEDDDEGRWVPARDFVGRCDYRGLDGNDGRYDFEKGCGGDDAALIGKDDFNPGQCWEMNHFANPVQGVNDAPRYAPMTIEKLGCEMHEWFTGCYFTINGRIAQDDAVLFVSSEPPLATARGPLSFDGCHYVEGMLLDSFHTEAKYTWDFDRDWSSKSMTVTYKRCQKGSKKATFQYGPFPGSTLEDCAWKAMEYGAKTIALRNPGADSNNRQADCYVGDLGTVALDSKDVLSDSSCKGQVWDPWAFDQRFTFNGGKTADAVYQVEHSDHAAFPIEPGQTAYIQVLDRLTCSVSPVYEMVYE